MGLVYYSLDSSIAKFFESRPPVTRSECDELAISLVGEPVFPVPIQGCFSYTVIAGAEQSTIIQFRAEEADLDTEILDLAQQIHGKLVPAYTYYGHIGQSSPLSIYVIERVPSIPYIQAQFDYLTLHHSNTVSDFAMFFAQAWNRRQVVDPSVVQAIHSGYRRKLELLSQGLPSKYRFAENLEKALKGLPALFTSSYPFVLSHGDLSAMNIIVDPKTGHTTGVVDWSEAKILPFGVSLWGLENTLGYMDSQGWHYLDNHRELEDLFWRTFEQAVG